MTKENTVDIIIPTFNNVNQLQQCIASMVCTKELWPMRLIIVNNGHEDCEVVLPKTDVDITAIVPKDGNVGWTGGLVEGLKKSDSKYVLFANDDIFIPPASYRWLRSMVRILLNNRSLAAVGPSTNCAMGLQNIWSHTFSLVQRVPFLIGFCMLVDREKLDEVGGVDPAFNTGDDIDLSIRLRDNEYGLVVDKSTFVYHHGFQTGTRVYGDHTKPNGWNSPEMTSKTNDRLIRKHGFLKWWHTMVRVSESEKINSEIKYPDAEGDIIRYWLDDFVKWSGDSSKVLDIGCGPRLTIKGSVGMDMIKNGYKNPHVHGESVATIEHDLNKGDMPLDDGSFEVIIARHILEHCVDPVHVLKEIYRVLDSCGKLIVCLPDEKINDTILMNPEHVHVFTSSSFVNMAEMVGFRVLNLRENYNGVSFTVLMEKMNGN